MCIDVDIVKRQGATVPEGLLERLASKYTTQDKTALAQQVRAAEHLAAAAAAKQVKAERVEREAAERAVIEATSIEAAEVERAEIEAAAVERAEIKAAAVEYAKIKAAAVEHAGKERATEGRAEADLDYHGEARPAVIALKRSITSRLETNDPQKALTGRVHSMLQA